MQEAPYKIEERTMPDGITKWVAIRARGAQWSWLTVDEVKEIAEQWTKRYGQSQP